MSRTASWRWDGLQRALAPTTAASGASNNANTAAAPPAALAVGGGDETRPAACPEGCPVEPFCESVAFMEALLREWFEGLGGSPSVRELEKRFGSRWRYVSFFSPAVLRPEEAGEMGGGAAGGDGPFGPVAGQVSQGLGQGAGSSSERSAEIGCKHVQFYHFYLNLPVSARSCVVEWSPPVVVVAATARGRRRNHASRT
jgi:hypothetical protein